MILVRILAKIIREVKKIIQKNRIVEALRKRLSVKIKLLNGETVYATCLITEPLDWSHEQHVCG